LTVPLSSGAADAAEQFSELCARFGKLDFFCINDTSDNAAPDAPQLLRIGDTLEQLLPCPSVSVTPAPSLTWALR